MTSPDHRLTFLLDRVNSRVPGLEFDPLSRRYRARPRLARPHRGSFDGFGPSSYLVQALAPTKYRSPRPIFDTLRAQRLLSGVGGTPRIAYVFSNSLVYGGLSVTNLQFFFPKTGQADCLEKVFALLLYCGCGQLAPAALMARRQRDKDLGLQTK